jgi:hypothetical protein
MLHLTQVRIRHQLGVYRTMKIGSIDALGHPSCDLEVDQKDNDFWHRLDQHILT